MVMKRKITACLKYNTMNRFILFGSVILLVSCHKNVEVVKETPKVDSTQFVEQVKGISEKDLLNYVQSAPKILPNKNNGEPFKSLDYDKIIAYDFNGDEKMYDAAINDKGKFIPIIEKQKTLTQNQADKILKALSKNKSYGEAGAACFEPHLGIVFFKNNKKVNQMSICLDCNGSTTEIAIPARTHRVFNKGTENEYSFTGFTPYGRNAVKELCKELGFYYKDFGKK